MWSSGADDDDASFLDDDAHCEAEEAGAGGGALDLHGAKKKGRFSQLNLSICSPQSVPTSYGRANETMM
ncbi:hypothetical protein PG988_012840 [Apiospora saccharicola]